MGQGKRHAFAWMLAALFGLTGAAQSAHAGSEIAAPATSHRLSTAQWAALFDTATPLPERQHMLADVERDVGGASADELYLLGSLYHMGQHAPGSPVEADQARAATYFAAAAMRGSMMAMAKLAEVKFQAGDYREAMNWAQIYAYYARNVARQGPAAQTYALELVNHVQANVNPSSMDDIMKDVNSFLRTYDKNIRAGMAIDGLDHPDIHPESGKRHYNANPNEHLPDAGIADFLVGFDDSGKAVQVQLLDMLPYATGMDAMRAYAASMKVEPAADKAHALRYMWVPIVMGDRSYTQHNRP